MTWTHLFAADPRCDAPDAPAWFRDRLPAVAAAGGPRVLIGWGRARPAGLSAYDGLVSVNRGGPTAAEARAAGFAEVRRFAVLPSLAEARWFIPLDTPALASAGFGLYNPTRWSARAKLRGARWLVRARAPFWFSDELMVAQRSRPPLVEALEPFLADRVAGVAFSSGAPEPARNRKVSVALLGAGGGVLAYAKVGDTPLARSLVRREAEALATLAPMRVAPRLVFSGEAGGRRVTAQRPIAGSPAGVGFTGAHRAFLAALRVGPYRPASETGQVAALPARVAALESPRPDLAALVGDLMPRLAGLTVPETVVHGDFAPWNLLTHRGELAAFDWEYAEPSGLPLVDEFHHRLQVGFLLRGWAPADARDCLAAVAAGGPLGLAPAQVNDLGTVYLLDVVIRLLEEGYEDNAMLRFYVDVLSRCSVGSREAVAS